MIGKVRLVWGMVLSLILVVVMVLPGCAREAPTSPTPTPTPTPLPTEQAVLKIGLQFDMTGPIANLCATMIEAWEDSIRYWNEEEGGIEGVKIEGLYRDSRYTVDGCLACWEDVKDEIVCYRFESSQAILALRDKLIEANMPCLSQSSHPKAVYPPATIFTYYPTYPDQGAAFLDWVKDSWKGEGEPKVAILTTDSPMGRGCWTPELREYAASIGLEPVAEQYVPKVVVDITPQLEVIRASGAQYTFGCMTGTEFVGVMDQARKLGLTDTITFGTCTPGMFSNVVKSVGPEPLEAAVLCGQWAPWSEDCPQIRKMQEIHKKYHDGEMVVDDGYGYGWNETVLFHEAVRLALEKVSAKDMTSKDLLEYGFYRIKDFDTGGLQFNKVTFGPDKVQAMTSVPVWKMHDGEYVKQGSYILHYLAPKE